MCFIHNSSFAFIFWLGCAFTTIAADAPHSAALAAAPVVGAIRWDAWVGDDSQVGRAVERSLSPERWHYRLPFYAKVISKDQVQARGNRQAIMDREISYASDAGLDYWAFVLYPPGDAMTRGGLDLYLASAKKREINFCAICSLKPGDAAGSPERLAALFRDPGYQKVLGKRPLVYLLEPSQAASRFGSWEAVRAAVGALRDAAAGAGLERPYLAAMDWSPEACKMAHDQLGLDAVSSYSSNGAEKGAPYARLAAYTQDNWDRYAAKGVDVIPWVTAGWDRRPRVEHPVFWETSVSFDAQVYYEPPTPRELSDHLEAAIEWNRRRSSATNPNAIIIYAWNELDEGGWLVPTLSEGAARLEALRKRRD